MYQMQDLACTDDKIKWSHEIFMSCIQHHLSIDTHIYLGFGDYKPDIALMA